MMKIPWKCLWSVLLIGCLLWSNGTVVEAAGSSADLTKTGSITVQLQSGEEDHTPIAGAKLSVYKVATVASKQGLLTYTYTPDFDGCGMSLEDLQADQLAEQLMAWADQKQRVALADATTGDDGKAQFAKLEMGLYLVRQQNTVSGYGAMEPFVVALPMTNAAGTGWDYEVLAQPKASVIPPYIPPTPGPDPKPDPEPEPTPDPTPNPDPDQPPTPTDPTNPDAHGKRLRVEKQWSDANKAHAPITVRLYRNQGEYVESVTLSADNQWTHEWTGLDGYSTWYVL